MAVNASPKPGNNNNAYYQSNSKGRVWVNNNRGVGRDGKGSNTQYSQYSQSHSPDQYNQFSQNQAPRFEIPACQICGKIGTRQ